MDAPEDDSDVRLQKVAGDLIGDFDRSLESFLFRRRRTAPASTTTTTTRIAHARVRTREAQRMAGLLDPFQEYPQLLDSHLARWLPLLADAFLASVAAARTPAPAADTAASTASHIDALTQPLQAAVALLLYTLCKVRGEKVVVGFLPVATRHLEPLLGALEAQAGDGDAWSWQERYIVLLWLSQLLLAPFDLATISTKEEEEEEEGDDDDHNDDDHNDDLFVWPSNPLPSITVRILPLARRYLAAPGKERDAARVLLVRLAMRRDMQQLGVRDALVQWARAALTPPAAVDRSAVTPAAAAAATAAGPYYYIGVLAFLAGLLSAAAGTSDMDDSLAGIFQTVHAVAEDEDDEDEVDNSSQRALFASIRSSAVARKTMVKALRAVAVRCIQKQQQQSVDDSALDGAVEATIGYLLGRLADNDTPVRFAASKALGVITLRLAPDRAAEVIDAVLDALERNVLYTVGNAGRAPVADLTAVDPLEWHGLMLTLAHLLYRRAPPLAALPAVAAALLRGLAFERRSLSGSATGTNVRDAACFGLWALARRYATGEVAEASATTESGGLLQTLATHLVVAAALDPAGNIRRGSSAALQELVGRHPDTVCCGIALVQAVDYHAVALRARAARSVAGAAAALAPQPYGAALLRDGLLGWRGLADAADAGARRVAAASFGHIAALLASAERTDGGGSSSSSSSSSSSRGRPLAQMADALVVRLRALQPRQVEERHGLLLALAAVLDEVPALVAAAQADDCSTPPAALPLLGQVHAVLDACRDVAAAAGGGPAQRRPDLLAEAACRLIVSAFPVVQMVVLPHAAPCSLLSGPSLVAEAARVPPSAVFSEAVAALDTAAASSADGLPAVVRAFTDLVSLCLSVADPASNNNNSSAAWLARQEPDVVAATSDAALILLVLLSPPGSASSSTEDARDGLLHAWADVVSRPGASGPVRSRYMAGGGSSAGAGAGAKAGTAGSGYVFALTKALPLVTAVRRRTEALSPSSQPPPLPILQAILDRWAADRAIDTRVALLQALAQSPAVLVSATATTRTALRAVLAAGLDDYTTDARGDVGSHVRLQALRATQVLWGCGGGDGGGGGGKGPAGSDMLLLRVLRLAAEKLDRVRVAAQAALVQALSLSSGAAAKEGKRLGAQTFSSQAYFRCLLALLDVVVPGGADAEQQQLRWMAALMRGYATSADTGNEDLVVASRAALVDFLAGEDGEGCRRRRTTLVWRALLRNLPGGTTTTTTTAVKKPVVPPDRIVVPTLELVAFLFYAGVVPDNDERAATGRVALCHAVRQAADKAGSVRKVEACVKVYGAVAAEEEETTGPAAAAEARQQLAALLQHPWPRVRAAVVDELWGLGLRTASAATAAEAGGPYAALKGVDWAVAEPATTAALATQLGLVQ